MPIVIRYRCPECAEAFKWPKDAEPPDRCQLCGAWVNAEDPPDDVFVPKAPAIRKSDYAKSIDQTYRAMETQSAARAEEAASMLADQYRKDNRESPFESDPRVLHDFQEDQIKRIREDLKITNMEDPSTTRPGDISAITPAGSGEAQRLMVGGQAPGFRPMAGGVPTAGGTRDGSGALRAVTGHGGWVNGTPASPNRAHQQRAAAVVRAGEMGRH